MSRSKRLLHLANVLLEAGARDEAEALFQSLVAKAQETTDLDHADAVEVGTGALLCAVERLDRDAMVHLDRWLEELLQCASPTADPKAYFARAYAAQLMSDVWGSAQSAQGAQDEHRVHLLWKDFARVSRGQSQLVLGQLKLAQWHVDHRNARPFRTSRWIRLEAWIKSFLSRPVSKASHKEKAVACDVLASIYVQRGLFELADGALRRAYSYCLESRNTVDLLDILLKQAKVARLLDKIHVASKKLSILRHATEAPEWRRLRLYVQREEQILLDTAVDWIIDADRGVIVTRDRGEIVIGKQHVLLDLLKALSLRHAIHSSGVSKAEIIQTVWHEMYRPDAHDNKLYYNINRLRKLIEPNVREPQYVLNCELGYRLAPGLKIRLLERVKHPQSIADFRESKALGLVRSR